MFSLKVEESEAEREARLKNWKKFLETGEKSEGTAVSSSKETDPGPSNGSSISTSEVKTGEELEDKSTNSSGMVDAAVSGSSSNLNETDVSDTVVNMDDGSATIALDVEPEGSKTADRESGDSNNLNEAPGSDTVENMDIDGPNVASNAKTEGNKVETATESSNSESKDEDNT